MQQQERDQVAKALTQIAFLYGHELTREALSMFVNALINFLPATCEQYLRGITAYTNDPKNFRFPNPAQLRPYIFPETAIDHKTVANDIARKIQKSVLKFGSYWSEGVYGADGVSWEGSGNFRYATWESAAVSVFGEIGLQVVSERGGWSRVCESCNTSDEGQWIAQLRDHIQAVMTLASQGIKTETMKLEKSDQAAPSFRLIQTVSENKDLLVSIND